MELALAVILSLFFAYHVYVVRSHMGVLKSYSEDRETAAHAWAEERRQLLNRIQAPDIARYQEADLGPGSVDYVDDERMVEISGGSRDGDEA